MRTHTLLLAAMISASFATYAQDKPTTPPPTGSATTQQESPAHPAAKPGEATESKAKPTARTEKQKHPAVAENKDTAAPAAPATAAAGNRNWAQIDTDRDNLVSPDEMQKFLEAEWAKRKQSS